MKALTLSELSKAIRDIGGRNKKAPEGLLDLIHARNFLTGAPGFDLPPAKDPRDVLVSLGYKW